MKRITVSLESEEKEALLAYARQEKRDPRRQEALIICQHLQRAGLLKTKESPKFTFGISTESASEDLHDELKSQPDKVIDSRGLHIEKMAAAYLLECDLYPSEVELVERKNGNEIVWFFQKKGAV